MNELSDWNYIKMLNVMKRDSWTSIKTCNVEDRDTTPSYQNRSSHCFASYILQSNWQDYHACSRLIHAYYCLFDNTSNTSNRELTLQARELTFNIPIIYIKPQ